MATSYWSASLAIAVSLAVASCGSGSTATNSLESAPSTAPGPVSASPSALLSPSQAAPSPTPSASINSALAFAESICFDESWGISGMDFSGGSGSTKAVELGAAMLSIEPKWQTLIADPAYAATPQAQAVGQVVVDLQELDDFVTKQGATLAVQNLVETGRQFNPSNKRIGILLTVIEVKLGATPPKSPTRISSDAQMACAAIPKQSSAS